MVVFIAPFLAFWALIYPVICLFYLYKKRKLLHKIDVKARVNFYINGYKTKYYYWSFFKNFLYLLIFCREFVIMYRKILFISVNFFRGMEIFTKAAILLLFSATSVILTAFHQPFAMNKLNQLELYSNLAVCISIYAGALYVQDRVNETIKIFLFLFILFVNLIFGLMWLLLAFELFFFNHFKCFFKYFPKLSKSLVVLGKSFSKTKFEWNLMKYANNLARTIHEYNLHGKDITNAQIATKRRIQNNGSIKQLNTKTIKPIVKMHELQ